MNNLRFIFLLLFFPFCFFHVSAQTDPPLRIELDCAKDQQDYKSVLLSKHGVAVFYQTAVINLDTAQWVFVQYDTNLVKKNLFKIKIPNLCQYFTAHFADNKLFVFFQKPAFKKDTLKNYLLEWNIRTKDFHLHELHQHKYPYLSSMQVVGDHLLMIIDDQKMKSIIYYNYKTHAKKAIQFADDEIMSVESLVVDTVARKSYFCMFLKNKKSSRAELFSTDYSGNIITRETFPYSGELVYNSVKITISGKDSLLIVGGFTNIKENKHQGCYSGIYTLSFVKNRFVDLNTHSFGAFSTKDSEMNTKYLSESGLTMNEHIKQCNGHIFVITDVFHPEYQYAASSFRNYGYFGYDQPTHVFMGYRFLNAYILEFDRQGALLNEWYFPISNVLTQSPYPLVDLYQDTEDNTLMYYVYKNDIVSQYMHGKQVIAAQSAIPITLLSKADILEYSSNISMQHWNEHYFLLSGYQYIKNAQRGKGKRYVFFLNKLICE